MARLRLGSWSSIVAEFNLSSFLFLFLGDILVSTLSASFMLAEDRAADSP